MVISSRQSVNTVGATHAPWQVIALQHTAAAQQTRPLLLTAGDIAQDVSRCREAHQRTEVGCFLKRVAGTNPRHAGEDFPRTPLLARVGINTRVPLVRAAGAVEVGHHRDIGGEVGSASSQTISGDLPPSSMVTSFSDEAAELAITFCRWRRRR